MISIQRNEKTYIENQPFELVERKGIGHPDTLCDAIAERASRYYSQYFFKRYGGIAHHWFDKVMIIGGQSHFTFGQGELIRPYKVIFAGKAAKTFGGEEIPLNDLLRKAACDVLSESLTGFEKDRHLVIQNDIVDYVGAGRDGNRYQPQSRKDLFMFGLKGIVSNDCNLLSGYAPLSLLEQLVLNIERYINSREFKFRHPVSGWDVKIVGCRENDNYFLIINIPFISKLVHTIKEYFDLKRTIIDDIERYLEENYDTKQIKIVVNPQDRNGRFYLTVLGSVADTGDVGVVGRGNRINGLITPMRPMSIEAPAGKNPIDHTGKLYGIMADRLAKKVSLFMNKPVEVNLFTSKETEIGNPDHLSLLIFDWDKNPVDQKQIETMVTHELNSIADISRELIFDGITMW